MKAIVFIFLVFILYSCNQSSIHEKDPSAGFNGSFEKVIHGLPANWYIYAPSDYQKNYVLSYDTSQFKEGKQSLKFEVHSLDTSNFYQDWRRPGMFQMLDATAGDKYKLSFWIKNNGCDFRIRAFSLGFGMPSKVLLATKEDFPDWTNFDYLYTVPDSCSGVRFELSIRSAGTFWIDDIRIDKLNE